MASIASPHPRPELLDEATIDRVVLAKTPGPAREHVERPRLKPVGPIPGDGEQCRLEARDAEPREQREGKLSLDLVRGRSSRARR